MPDYNALNTVSGSTGITGCADGVFVLKKSNHSQIATLYATGRDIEEMDLSLKFNENCVWDVYEKPKLPEKNLPAIQVKLPTKAETMQKEIMAEIEENVRFLNCTENAYKNFAKKRMTILLKKFADKTEQFEGTLGELAVELQNFDNAANFSVAEMTSYITTYSSHLWK